MEKAVLDLSGTLELFRAKLTGALKISAINNEIHEIDKCIEHLKEINTDGKELNIKINNKYSALVNISDLLFFLNVQSAKKQKFAEMVQKIIMDDINEKP